MTRWLPKVLKPQRELDLDPGRLEAEEFVLDADFRELPQDAPRLRGSVLCRHCKAGVHLQANVCLACGHSTWGKWRGTVHDGVVYDVKSL